MSSLNDPNSQTSHENFMENVINDLKNQVRDYRKQLDVYSDARRAENKKREASPALQDAWDKYQVLLKLTA